MALKIAVTSLSGGQGKSTLSLFLARKLSEIAPTLVIDTDPQHNLTTYLGVQLQPHQPTLLEFLKDTVSFEDAVYPVSIRNGDNLFLIPADDGFDSANDYLSGSGLGAMLLSRRLEFMSDVFQFCVIDSPPQRSQISKTVIGAADFLVIPAEANAKGFGSLIRTLDLFSSMKKMRATTASLIGVVPFRDKWVGLNQTRESRFAIEGMKEEANVLPSIRESEKYKEAINHKSQLQNVDLEYPIEYLMQQILERANIKDNCGVTSQ